MDFSREFDEKFPALLSSPSLESFFRGYNALDADSLIPVVKSGLFRGLRRDLVRLTGRLVDFRGGALEFVRAKNVETWIVSQSWYAEMVAESLIPAGIPSSRVVSSRLVYNRGGTAGGALDPLCGGCLAKRLRAREILRGESPRGRSSSESILWFSEEEKREYNRGEGVTGGERASESNAEGVGKCPANAPRSSRSENGQGRNQGTAAKNTEGNRIENSGTTDNTTENSSTTIENGSSTIENGSSTIENGSSTIENGSSTIENGSSTTENGTMTRLQDIV